MRTDLSLCFKMNVRALELIGLRLAERGRVSTLPAKIAGLVS